MKPLARYAGSVLFPVTVGVFTTLWATASAFDELQREADFRIAASATHLIEQEMGAARDSMIDEAEAVRPTPPYAPAVEAALRGDTVLALGSSQESLELTVVYGDGPMVRIATGPFRPATLNLLPSITGYRLALYLRGKRTATTEPPVEPAVLHPETLLALARRPDGMRIDTDGTTGMLRAFQAIPGRGSDVVVLAAADPAASLRIGGMTAPATVLMVVILLSAFAAWTIHHPRGRPQHSRIQWALVVLVPVIAGGAIVLSQDLDFRRSVNASMREQLNRAIILVGQVDRLGSVSAASAATGFDAVRLRAGQVDAATSDRLGSIEDLRQVRPPPPNFTSSGVVDSDEGARFYSASRTGDGATLVLIGPSITRSLAKVRREIGVGAVLILLPPLLFLWLSERPGSEAGPHTPREDDGSADWPAAP